MLGAALILTLVTWGALLARITSDPTNHVSIEPLLAMVPFVILVPLSWTRTPARPRLRVALTAYGLASILAMLGVDRANILVQYDRWTERGMPERPCAGISRHLWACEPWPRTPKGLDP
jgi:hypothetical protein